MRIPFRGDVLVLPVEAVVGAVLFGVWMDSISAGAFAWFVLAPLWRDQNHG